MLLEAQVLPKMPSPVLDHDPAAELKADTASRCSDTTSNDRNKTEQERRTEKDRRGESLQTSHLTNKIKTKKNHRQSYHEANSNQALPDGFPVG